MKLLDTWYTLWWFDMCEHWKDSPFELADTPITSHIFLVCENIYILLSWKISIVQYSAINYNTTFYIWSLGLIYLIAETLYFY